MAGRDWHCCRFQTSSLVTEDDGYKDGGQERADKAQPVEGSHPITREINTHIWPVTAL